MTGAKSAQIAEIEPDDAGQRLDNYLLRVMNGLPRARVYRAIRRGEVRVNGSRAQPARRLARGDKVRIPPLAGARRAGSSLGPVIDLTRHILFENEALIVLNKPPGLASHGGSGIQMGAIEALRVNRPDERRLALAHRLDRDTSGCLMIAKRRAYLRALHDALREGAIRKRYICLVHGQVDDGWGGEVREALLTRASVTGEKTTRVNSDGKPALTRFKLLGQGEDAALLEARPETGRTHQIRVHARHARLPIVGDPKYGDELRDQAMRAVLGKRPQLMLHAQSLAIPALVGFDAVEVSAPVPEQLAAAIECLLDIKASSIG